MTKVLQTGLTSKNRDTMEEFADRVSEYNKEKGMVVVELSAQERNDGLWELEMQFASRQYAKDFWLDPKHQKQVLV